MQAMTRSDKKRGGGAEWEEEEWEEEDEEDVPSLPETGARNLALGVGWGGVGCGAGCRVRGAGWRWWRWWVGVEVVGMLCALHLPHATLHPAYTLLAHVPTCSLTLTYLLTHRRHSQAGALLVRLLQVQPLLLISDLSF